jgi:hypothetical protein
VRHALTYLLTLLVMVVYVAGFILAPGASTGHDRWSSKVETFKVSGRGLRGSHIPIKTTVRFTAQSGPEFTSTHLHVSTFIGDPVPDREPFFLRQPLVYVFLPSPARSVRAPPIS